MFSLVQSPFAELVARYQELRQLGLRLNNLLTSRIPKDVLMEGARDLGFVGKKDVLVFQSEDETCVLMDYCIHNLRRDGRNAVQQLLAESPPSEGSDEALLLEAMAKSWYSVFAIQKVERGAGVRVVDMLRETEHLLIDLGLSRTAPRGGMLATRVIPLDGFIMTSGAGLPLGGSGAYRDEFVAGIQKTIFAGNITSFRTITPQQEQRLARTIIRTALRWGASEQIRYRGPEEPDDAFVDAPPERLVPATRGRIGRNEPCPCGSGKKFKKCCARG